MAHGGSRKNSGRKPMATSKEIKQAREAIAKFCDMNSSKIQTWFDKVAEDNPEKALDILYKYMEFHVPKLSRQDWQPLGSDGEPTDLNIEVTFVKNSNNDS